MTDTTHIRVYGSDKERIERLTDDDKSWSAKVTQIVDMAEESTFQDKED